MVSGDETKVSRRILPVQNKSQINITLRFDVLVWLFPRGTSQQATIFLLDIYIVYKLS